MWTSPAVSIVLTFQDHEETIGHQVRTLVNHLVGMCDSYEILAVDTGAQDNSYALLGLLSRDIPQLRLFRGSPHNARAIGCRHAKGKIVVFAAPQALNTGSMGVLGTALRRIEAKTADLLLLSPSLVVCDRRRCQTVFESPWVRKPHRLVQRALAKGLKVESSFDVNGGVRSSLARMARVFARPGYTARTWQS